MSGKEAIEKVISVPIVVNSSYSEYVTEDFVKAIVKERMEQIEKGTFENEATDTETLIYLLSASLEVPFNDDATEILLYLLTKVMGKFGIEVPEDLKVTTLSDERMEMLNSLKRTLRESSLKAYKKKVKKGEKKNG